MNGVRARGRYQGVLQILHFNWRMYLLTAASVSAGVLIWPFLPMVCRAALLIGATPTLFWMTASLAVSHYVYDCFPLYDLHWLERALGRAPRRWINIHSGWDETSELLAGIFPDAVGEAVDIFDPAVMTEISIRQARRANRSAIASMPARYDALPFESATVDTAFVIFAAHELRKADQRERFFREIGRVLTAGGDLVVMEHARDAWNFLAFGPGFLHFFPRRTWRHAALQAGLEVRSEFAMTRFIHVFVMRRPR
jgi:SAM-dependent methyltransferase